MGGQQQETPPRSQADSHPVDAGNRNGAEGLRQQGGESDGEQGEQGETKDPQDQGTHRHEDEAPRTPIEATPPGSDRREQGQD